MRIGPGQFLVCLSEDTVFIFQFSHKFGGNSIGFSQAIRQITGFCVFFLQLF